MGGQRGPKSNPELEHGKCISSHTLSIQTLRLGMHSGLACPLRTYFVPEAELIVCQNGVNGCVGFASGVNRQRRDKAPCFAMSEYDSRSKCVEFECQNSGFAREIIVRDDRESTETHASAASSRRGVAPPITASFHGKVGIFTPR